MSLLRLRGLPAISASAVPGRVILPDATSPYRIANTSASDAYVRYDASAPDAPTTAAFLGTAVQIRALGGSVVPAGRTVNLPRGIGFLDYVCATNLSAALLLDAGWAAGDDADVLAAVNKMAVQRSIGIAAVAVAQTVAGGANYVKCPTGQACVGAIISAPTSLDGVNTAEVRATTAADGVTEVAYTTDRLGHSIMPANYEGTFVPCTNTNQLRFANPNAVSQSVRIQAILAV